ncbi:MAG TPA: hypothetical protein VE988_14365 [Gemmataceae bacterium]|nr:hypothetical protein [Gemmataceae bacterium]
MAKQNPQPQDLICGGLSAPKDREQVRSDDDESLDAEQIHRATWAEFGLRAPDYSNMHRQEAGPTVNLELVRQFYDKELVGDELDHVAALVVDFETWSNALGELALTRPPRR